MVQSPVQIIKVKEACEIARKVLDEVKEIVEPGVTTDDLDNFDREYIVIHNAYPSPLNFNPLSAGGEHSMLPLSEISSCALGTDFLVAPNG